MGSSSARCPAQLCTCMDTDPTELFMTSFLTPGGQEGGREQGQGTWGQGAQLLAAWWGPAPGGGCMGRCCIALRCRRRQWESVSAPAQLKLLFKARAGKSRREMRRGRFWEQPRIPLPVGAAAPGQLQSWMGGDWCDLGPGANARRPRCNASGQPANPSKVPAERVLLHHRGGCAATASCRGAHWLGGTRCCLGRGEICSEGGGTEPQG